jgi:hypothetical protein
MNRRSLLIGLALCLGTLFPSLAVTATPFGRLFSLASERQKLDALRIISKQTPAIKQKSTSTIALPNFQAKLAKDQNDQRLADHDEKYTNFDAAE